MHVRESAIEQELIAKLGELKYTLRPDIRDRNALECNFLDKFDALNRVYLTNGERSRLLDEIVSDDVFIAAQRLRDISTFIRDDGTPLHYTLVNTRDWCKNTFEVVNQLRINHDVSHHRYDVILLINGVPVVQIELKTLGISPRRAMQQIVDYKSDLGNGYTRTLLCFMQLFIVSNRTNTYYFANNNPRHFNFSADEQFLPVYQFADEANNKISHLDAFADAFLAKCTLGQMLSRYMVLVASEQKLLMMRPYQIYAVKAIVDCIDKNGGNGYVWHTTGSGKTLTSFKASTLLKDNPDIEKCLFVVDRKDLDRQTREEFNRFQEGCVEENTNTETLVRRLLSDDKADKVIVTTIQKLGLALDGAHRRNYAQRLEPLRSKRMVFIFDECHRSQFGENHQAITEFFQRAQLFGFTGTPIFNDNAASIQREGEKARMRTTLDLFQRELHAYTITHAIDDRNVLKFHVDYFKPEGVNPPKSGEAVPREKVIETILGKHDAATAQRRFNAVFATASINDAIEYYALFADIQAGRQAQDPDYRPLKIACVFSPPAKIVAEEGGEDAAKRAADVRQLQEDLPQEQADNSVDPEGKYAALKTIIADYNTRYGGNFRIGDFDQYYKDVQQRIKLQQIPDTDLPRKGAEKIDITIVVDMLLTGFDSKYLNTLYVDKNLKYHGLIQAFSRTNRVLNDSKPWGNILDFRQQQKAVDEAIELFSGEGNDAPARIWVVDAAPKVIEQLDSAMQRLKDFMQSQGLANQPEQVANLRGDAARSQFVTLFKEVQRLKTQVDQYTDITPEQQAMVDAVVSPDDLRAWRGTYLETAQRLKAQQQTQGESALPDVQNLDFEFVLFASNLIDYDYIMALVARDSGKPPSERSMTREQVIGLIQADAKFMDEREVIADYLRGLPTDRALDEAEIRKGYEAFKARRNADVLQGIAQAHGLDPEQFRVFVDDILRRRVFDGEALSALMAPLGLSWKDRTRRELDLMEDLTPVLERLVQGREIAGLSAYAQ
ncbi:type I restriction endonuclease subunit R [Xanthomonas translucens]|uniref:type I restriction endonuclease subunit R n=1 Tax=Xanthomonas campestris pv. translucens TaxID=343 RepID=UPI00071E9A13|nr:type I restriction endonuclease subunit R [Xanthomonas translucens]KTF41014.1 DEAD/DEAH box helicase [Xanthomonas translucens pv. translucens]KWV13484.1 DEAD/DEAH box helicase [Xanthomonas translucens]MCS3359762.1 type I restriction endonuclease subunit R [Xanthomonas translucens pv. translucens]MCS3373451.1 type I restriction endonuclease subunit R [Xanthomonas translucens pv. translucens]MCT8275120.1 type I restriction endonuclease subunit R [Xanthomonas translucens pv. translucens]